MHTPPPQPLLLRFQEVGPYEIRAMSNGVLASRVLLHDRTEATRAARIRRREDRREDRPGAGHPPQIRPLNGMESRRDVASAT